MGEWDARWRALAARDQMAGDEGEEAMVARWTALAKRVDSGAEQRPDPILDFVLSHIGPEMSVLDIGAAVGRWTVPIAKQARTVTAIEPVTAMRRVLVPRLQQHGLTNVRVAEEPWLEADVEQHDVAVAAFSMYTSPDLPAFARKMEALARQGCFLAMRIPAHDGVMGELSQQVYGEWHDSPNFVVGYNTLLEAGFTPDVYCEPRAVRYWVDPTLEAAEARVRRHLRLADDRFNAVVRETLERRLVKTEAGYRWPDWMRSAVVWWQPASRPD